MTYGKLFPPLAETYSQYRLTPWLSLSQQMVKTTKHLGLNRPAFSYYRKAASGNSAIEIRFRVCRALMPGRKPYYQLAIDGVLTGRPKKMLSGCSIVKERIKLSYDTGVISLFLFISRDGNRGELKPVSFSVKLDENKMGTVELPMASPVLLDRELQQYVKQFQIYAQNIKIKKPALFLTQNK